MKKMIALALAVTMLFSVAACGAGQQTAEQSGTSKFQSQPEVTTQPEVTIQPEDEPPAPEETPAVEETSSPSQQPLQLSFAESYEEIYQALQERRKAYENQMMRYALGYAITDEMAEVPTGEAFNSGADFSGTNVQVEGIDEGDIVKTDGEYIFILLDGTELVILKAEGADSAVVSRTELGGYKAGGTPRANVNVFGKFDRSAREIFICGDTLAVVWDSYYWNESDKSVPWSYDSRHRTEIDFYDVSDPSCPRLRETLGQDGSVLGTRLCGSRLYVITSWGDYNLDNTGIRELEDLVPALYAGNERRALAPNDICICSQGASQNYVLAAVYHMEDMSILDSQSVLGGGNGLYMSRDNIYVYGSAWSDGAGNERREGIYTVIDYAPRGNTTIHRFAVTDSGLELQAQGLIPGNVDSQFSLDEYMGKLRVVTTNSGSLYSVYMDEENGFANVKWHQDVTRTSGLYILDSGLNIVGSVEDLAPGETVYSARFDGDIAYFCTFEQVDPLFAVDCSEPEKPVVLSALKISGFSEYLHYWDEGLLFGFGYEADESTGWVEGLKMVMFDTADKTDVTVASSLHLKDITFSAALYDHHAFFISPEKNIIGFVGDSRYYIYGYSAEEGFYERACFDFNGWDYEGRGLYIGDEIYIIGRHGACVLDLESCDLVRELNW